MNFKRQKIGLVFLLVLSVISAAFWMSNTNHIQNNEVLIQDSIKLEFNVKELTVSLYQSNTQVNNDEINDRIFSIDANLLQLKKSLYKVDEKNSIAKIRELENIISSLKYNIQSYKSSHALIKNSVSYVNVKHLDAFGGDSHKRDISLLHEKTDRVLFSYYADTLDVQGDYFQEKETDSPSLKLLFLHVRQILKQYAMIKVQKINIDSFLQKSLDDLEGFRSYAKDDIQEIQDINKIIFLVFVVTTIWLLIYGFSSLISTQKSYLEVRTLKNELQQFVDALNNSAIVSKTDAKGIITFANDKFVEVSGYTQSELIGQSHTLVRHDDMPAKFFQELWKEISSKNTFHGLIKNKNKTGQPYYVDTHISAILDLKGTIVEYVAVRYDVTELIHARDEALSAQKTKDQFLSTMSHELRTPLNAVIGFTELLQKKLTDEPYVKYINHISSSSKDLLRLINDILDLAKIQNGSFMIVNEKFKIASDFISLIERYKAHAKDSHIELVCTCNISDDVILYGDWLRISQVVSNLVSNALKFTHSHGKVRCKVAYEEGELSILIEDTGIGMTKQAIESIFVPFVQGDGSTTREHGGTGLGLSIAKDLVEMMGGDLKVHSEVNKGSSFRVHLSLQQCQEKEEKPSVKIGKLKKSKILVVEDNKTNQLMLSLLLKDLGMECELADNGQIAVDMYEPGKYDIILMDENMPVLCGTEAMLKLHERYAQMIPIIVVTANATQGDREKFLEVGMDDYIAKPVDIDILREVLSQHLKA